MGRRVAGRISGILALIVGIASAWAEGERVIACPLSPRDIEVYGLPGDTPASQGFWAVGVREPIHLEAQVPKTVEIDDVDVDVVVVDVDWVLTVWPAGSTPSDDPDDPNEPGRRLVHPHPLLTNAVPIYDVADRQTFQIAERALFVPDASGLYTIVATITTTRPGGPIEQVDVTVMPAAATYVGVGTVGEEVPLTPQCAVCHGIDNKIEPWAETGHATMLERSISGLTSSHYGADCVGCHTVGHNASPGADNGGFDDVAADLGWVFPALLEPASWDAMPQALKRVSNIQCENCHGPGGEHSGDARTIAVSFDVGVCASCHDAGDHHTTPTEWKSSPHSVRPYRTTGSCARCHGAGGFVAFATPEVMPLNVDSETISCAVCHDSHRAGNEHQVRTTEDVALFNGDVVVSGGTGKLCMQCHISRRDAGEYVLENHGHYGPHYGPQTDMLAGTNAVQYGQYVPSSSGHLLAVGNSCATCHMQELGGDNPAVDEGLHAAGGHTFRMAWDPDPDVPDDEVDQAGVCASCHGEQDDFDVRTYKDYDGDGIAEGIQTEIRDLMEELAKALPPLDVAEVDDPTDDYTQAQRSAVYNYRFVEEDGSYGVHNPAYAAGILRASMDGLQSASAPAGLLGGEEAGDGWILSPWFGHYVPALGRNWIFHQYHGPLYVAPGSGGGLVSLWDPVVDSWLLTTPDLYPTLLIWSQNRLVRFESAEGGIRLFHDTETGETQDYPGFSFEPPVTGPLPIRFP